MQGLSDKHTSDSFVAEVVVGTPLAGETKSPSISASASFLTDEFDFVLAPPTDFFFADAIDESSVRLEWTPSPDQASGYIDGYVVRVFTSPEALIPISTHDVPGGGSNDLVLTGLSEGSERYARIHAYGLENEMSSMVGPIKFVAVSAERRLNGDVNGDGVTDGLDVLEVIFAIGMGGGTGHNAAADINGDGMVDATDLSLLQALLEGTP